MKSRGWIPKQIVLHIEHEKKKLEHTGACVQIDPKSLSAEEMAKILNGGK